MPEPFQTLLQWLLLKPSTALLVLAAPEPAQPACNKLHIPLCVVILAGNRTVFLSFLTPTETLHVIPTTDASRAHIALTATLSPSSSPPRNTGEYRGAQELKVEDTWSHMVEAIPEGMERDFSTFGRHQQLSTSMSEKVSLLCLSPFYIHSHVQRLFPSCGISLFSSHLCCII